VLAIILVGAALPGGRELARDAGFFTALCLFAAGATASRLHGIWKVTDAVFLAMAVLRPVLHFLR
jgi:hypothetical protein